MFFNIYVLTGDVNEEFFFLDYNVKDFKKVLEFWMVKRSIILAMPKHNDIYAEIIKNLEFHNFTVTFIDNSLESIKNFKYKKLTDRLIHSCRKIFLRDKTYKNKLKENFIFERIEQLLANNHYDYALVIRPDTFSVELLDLIRSHTQNRMVGYQWDGLSRFPEVNSRIKKFDDFYVFDANDLANDQYKNFHLKGITNFYFDMYKPTHVQKKGTEAYFIGCHFEARVNTINRCVQILSELEVDINFIIPTNNPKNIKQYDNHELIKFGIKNRVNFFENIKNVDHADILVDIINPVHQGLSFRVFEALHFKKKLITNNPIVRYFDFYHPNNMFIWDNNDNIKEALANFLAKPLVEIESSIMQKYGFGNWINYILDINPHQKIELPLQHEILEYPNHANS